MGTVPTSALAGMGTLPNLVPNLGNGDNPQLCRCRQAAGRRDRRCRRCGQLRETARLSFTGSPPAVLGTVPCSLRLRYSVPCGIPRRFASLPIFAIHRIYKRDSPCEIWGQKKGTVPRRDASSFGDCPLLTKSSAFRSLRNSSLFRQPADFRYPSHLQSGQSLRDLGVEKGDSPCETLLTKSPAFHSLRHSSLFRQPADFRYLSHLQAGQALRARGQKKGDSPCEIWGQKKGTVPARSGGKKRGQSPDEKGTVPRRDAGATT
jgi:hypothetical protein